jgi:hypothetical protein
MENRDSDREKRNLEGGNMGNRNDDKMSNIGSSKEHEVNDTGRRSGSGNFDSSTGRSGSLDKNPDKNIANKNERLPDDKQGEFSRRDSSSSGSE